jgi:hypothetical protein
LNGGFNPDLFFGFNSIFYPLSVVHLVQNKINCLRKSKRNKNEQLARNRCHLTFEIISKFRKPMRKQDGFKSMRAGHVLHAELTVLRRISSPRTKLLAARCECLHEHFHPITMLNS